MSRRLVMAFVIAFVVVQLAMPAMALLGDRPTRFGWQMFTAYAPPPEVSVMSTDGELRPVDLDELLALPRPEADLISAIVTALCDDPDTGAVLVERDGETRHEVCR